MIKDSVYRHALNKSNSNKYMGYDYKGHILKNSMSNRMFSTNKFMYDFLMKIEYIIHEIYESVKTIKSSMNISRDKFDRNFN